jgi:eukaryotic-like serine/threonine-protein kinase
MNSPRDHHEPDDDTPIVPISFAGGGDFGDARTTAQATPIRRAFIVGSAIVLFSAALAVIFVLPRYLTPEPPPAVAASAPAETAPEAETSAAATPEPEAVAELRRSNQAQLEQLLELVEQLEAKNITAWAANEFTAAREQITAGEKDYREQRYAAADTAYGQALVALQALVQRAEPVVAEAVDDGYAKLAARDAAGAEESFRFALTITPEHERAKSGLARAGTLDQVLALINEAAGYAELGDRDAALNRYREALALDADAPGAAAAIARIEQEKLDTRFARAMSDGLGAFAAGKFDAAKSDFKTALQLKPGSTDAADALAQVENRMLADQIAAHLRAAATAERDERWAEAAREYQQAAKLDSDLDGASAGASRAAARAQLDRQIETILAQPQRLADDGVHREARAVLAKARQQPAPGKRLSAQIARLDNTITLARTPVVITIISDGLTDVTLYRVGELGRFAQHSLSLIPGSYVAVGKRDGFRDVRVELTVSAAQADAKIMVRCEQKLAFGS